MANRLIERVVYLLPEVLRKTSWDDRSICRAVRGGLDTGIDVITVQSRCGMG